MVRLTVTECSSGWEIQPSIGIHSGLSDDTQDIFYDKMIYLPVLKRIMNRYACKVNENYDIMRGKIPWQRAR